MMLSSSTALLLWLALCLVVSAVATGGNRPGYLTPPKGTTSALRKPKKPLGLTGSGGGGSSSTNDKGSEDWEDMLYRRVAKLGFSDMLGGGRRGGNPRLPDGSNEDNSKDGGFEEHSEDR